LDLLDQLDNLDDAKKTCKMVWKCEYEMLTWHVPHQRKVLGVG
jgi:hypothetical protein